MVCDTVKAYIRVILISFKANRDKTSSLARTRSKLTEDIQRIEKLNKKQVTVDSTKELKAAYEDLNIIDAHVIAQDVMYAKQNVFDYLGQGRETTVLGII